MKISYDFSSSVWKYESTAGWYFVSLPKKISKEIRENSKDLEEGWGRLKAEVCLGKSQWKTAIWFDTKMDTYILPLKADIRRRERIEVGHELSVKIWI